MSDKYWVNLYSSRNGAKVAAIALGIDNYQICQGSEAMSRKPSQLSQ